MTVAGRALGRARPGCDSPLGVCARIGPRSSSVTGFHVKRGRIPDLRGIPPGRGRGRGLGGSRRPDGFGGEPLAGWLVVRRWRERFRKGTAVPGCSGPSFRLGSAYGRRRRGTTCLARLDSRPRGTRSGAEVLGNGEGRGLERGAWFPDRLSRTVWGDPSVEASAAIGGLRPSRKGGRAPVSTCQSLFAGGFDDHLEAG